MTLHRPSISTYDDSTVKCLLFGTFTHRHEDEIHMATGWRQRLEGACGTKTGMDRVRYGYKHSDCRTRDTRRMLRNGGPCSVLRLVGRVAPVCVNES